MNKTYVLQAFMETPWAILHSKLLQLEEIVARHANGEKLDAEEVQTRVHGSARPPERRVKNAAILPLFGTIFPRANLMTDMSGATSAERFGAQFSALIADPDVSAIILDVDSPGGQVNGVQELADMIYSARGTKPIIAVANHIMASAAYWIGSAADEIVVSPSGEVGSIGVFSVHQDISAALEKDGVKVSIIKEGKYKAEGNPYEPLNEEAREAIQASVGEFYQSFVGAVAQHRGVSFETVRDGFGEGRMVGAEKAVELGMADRVATLNEVIEGLFNQNVSSVSAKAADVSGDGQAPIEQEMPQLLARERERLAVVIAKTFEGEPSMRIRELQAERAKLVERAQSLYDLAEKEGRDFTDEERAEYDLLLGMGESTGTIGSLDAKIEQIVADREKLRVAAEKTFDTGEAIKPDNEPKKSMTRAEYDKLGPDERIAFTRNGGRITE